MSRLGLPYAFRAFSEDGELNGMGSILPARKWSDIVAVVVFGFRSDPIGAIQGLYAFIVGRKVRGWNLLSAAAARNKHYYQFWIRRSEPAIARSLTGSGERRGRVAVLLLDDRNSDDAATWATVQSARRALGDDVILLSSHPRSFARELKSLQDVDRMAAESGLDWVAPIAAGDLFAPALGDVLAGALNKVDASIVYWDEDRLSGEKRTDPWLKPDWDPLFYLSRDGIGGACAIRVTCVAAVVEAMESRAIDAASVSEIIMRIAACGREGDVVHLPYILTHRRAHGFADAAHRQRLIERIWPTPVVVAGDPLLPDMLRISFPEPQMWPRVTVIVPTRDKPELLDACLEGLKRLDYKGDVEIIVVDNDSVDPRAIAQLKQAQTQGVNVIGHPGPFNFSAMNNRAVAQARGEMLCLLNNDVEMIDGEWLSTMVQHARWPDVGAVGALLLYPDRTVQHAGVAIGLGGAAGHVDRGLPWDEPGHRLMHRTSRRISAVTAACMVVRRDVYLAVGGLDESAFAVAFNDVDFCLRLQQAGYRNILAAEAMLIHHESKSRGSDMEPENFARYSRELAMLQDRWGTRHFQDPFHHPLFLRTSEKSVLAL